MAERRSAKEADDEPAAQRPQLSVAKIGQRGLRQIAELTGREPEGVSGIEPSEEGWLVTVEIVEIARIPSSTDVLGTYQAELDMDGELVSYRRVRRYSRGQGDDGDRDA
jgi:hypothetical protein